MSNTEKLESGKYQLISRWQIILGLLVLVISLGSLAYKFVAEDVRDKALNFDSQSQKQNVLYYYKKGHPVTTEEITILKEKVDKISIEKMEEKFMPREVLNEKLVNIGEALVRIEENQNNN